MLSGSLDFLSTYETRFEGDPERARHNLTSAHSSAAHLLRLVDDVLVGGDLTTQFLWADHESQQLFVTGTLKTDLLLRRRHPIDAKKIAAGKDIDLEKGNCDDALHAALPEAAFEKGGLSAPRLWKLATAGKI